MSMIGDWWTKLKGTAMEKLMEKELAKLPPEQRAVVMEMIKNNPETFQKIAKEVEELKKKGTLEVYATMTVMKKYQGELQKLATNKIVMKKP
jgi:uncharacterized protein YjgD (DUF1641 family)